MPTSSASARTTSRLNQPIAAGAPRRAYAIVVIEGALIRVDGFPDWGRPRLPVLPMRAPGRPCTVCTLTLPDTRVRAVRLRTRRLHRPRCRRAPDDRAGIAANGLEQSQGGAPSRHHADAAVRSSAEVRAREPARDAGELTYHSMLRPDSPSHRRPTHVPLVLKDPLGRSDGKSWHDGPGAVRHRGGRCFHGGSTQLRRDPTSRTISSAGWSTRSLHKTEGMRVCRRDRGASDCVCRR
jgi:hypothetical protein